jgi:tRNA A37 threonylcarbamoyladenosine dehydratase
MDAPTSKRRNGREWALQMIVQSDLNPFVDANKILTTFWDQQWSFAQEAKGKEDDDLDLTVYDWIIDAIDSINAKTALIKTAEENDVNIVSAMGAAGKFDTSFKVADISKTSTCPLAKVMRKRLRDIGIEHLPVVYSEEKPVPRDGDLGTLSYVPGSAGLCLAGYVIRSIAVQ